MYGTHWFKGLDQTLKRVKIVKEIFQQGVERIVTTHVTFQCLEPCINNAAILWDQSSDLHKMTPPYLCPPCHIYAPHGILWLCRQFFFAQPVLQDKRFSTGITQLLPIKWILPLLRTRSFIAPCDYLRRGGGSAELEEPAPANQFNPPASEKERPG